MKKTKSKLYLVLIMTVCFVITLIYPKAITEDGFYVKTVVSEEYDEFVESKFDELMSTQSDIANQTIVSLGKGIKVLLPEECYDYYVYPVFFDGNIKATIHVSNTDEGFAFTYTKSLSNELELLKDKTSRDNPLTLIRQRDYFYAENSTTRTLLDCYKVESNKTKSISELDLLPSVDTDEFSILNIEDSLTEKTINSKILTRGTVPVVKLSWKVYETQPSGKPWCASVTTTNILNNMGRNLTSSYMRTWLNDQDGLINSQVAEYLIRFGGYKSTKSFLFGKLSMEDVISQIDSGLYIYAGLERSGGGHAIAILGYNTLVNALHIHNPWYSYTETMGYGDTYVAGSYQYKWSGGAVYNIKP